MFFLKKSYKKLHTNTRHACVKSTVHARTREQWRSVFCLPMKPKRGMHRFVYQIKKPTHPFGLFHGQRAEIAEQYRLVPEKKKKKKKEASFKPKSEWHKKERVNINLLIIIVPRFSSLLFSLTVSVSAATSTSSISREWDLLPKNLKLTFSHFPKRSSLTRAYSLQTPLAIVLFFLRSEL